MKYRDKAYQNGEIPELNIETAREYYSELYEEFLDEVFGYESKISRDQWENSVVEKQAYIFKATQVREKIRNRAAMNVSYESK